MADEGDLIRAAARGEPEAFEQLVRLKRERVVRTAYQITGDPEEARDVAQWVFVRIWKAIRRYDPGRRFDTWLYRITVNVAIDMLRQRGPRGVLQPLPDDPSRLAVDGGSGGERQFDLAELQRAFLHLAARLGVKQRAVFVLKEIEGLETADVARVLGVRESTVRNHLLQARRVLREGIEREYPGLVPSGARRRAAAPPPDSSRDDESEEGR